MPIEKAVSYDDMEREGFAGGGSRRGGGFGRSRGRAGRSRGRAQRRSRSSRRAGPRSRGVTRTKRARAKGTSVKTARAAAQPSQRQPGLTKTAAQKSAEKAYNKKTAFKTDAGGFLKSDKTGEIVRSKTQVAKEGAKRAQERALRQLVAPSIQAGEAKQVTPTDSSIRAVAEAQKESMSAFNKQRTPEQLNKLAILNRAMGLNPTSGMGIMNSLKYNVTNPEFKKDVKQARQFFGSLPTPMNILRRIGTGLLTDFGGIKDAVTGAQKSQRQPGLFASEKDSKGLFGGMGEGIGNLFSGLRIGPSDAGSQRRGGDRRALNRDGSLSSAAVARDAAPVLSTPAANPVNQTTGAIDYSNAMASSPVLTTPAASPATLPTMAAQGIPYRLRDYYAGILGQNPAMYAAEGGRIGFERGGGISGRRPEGKSTKYDIVDAYMDKITRQLGGGEVRGNSALQKARQDAMRKAELAEAKIAAAHGVAPGQGVGGSIRSTYQPLLKAGINPEDLIDAETAAYIPETGFGNVGNEYVNMAVSALHPDFNAPVVAPDAPVVAPDAPVVAPDAPVVAPETTIMPSAPSALDYASPAATPATPASPATDMSQYYSNLFSPESTSANTPSIASQIAAQYLSPQQAQVYAANGGRIGFQDGGFTPLSEDQLSGGWSQQAADLTGLFDRRYGGYSGDLSYAYGKQLGPKETQSELYKKLGTTDLRGLRGSDRYNKALNEIKADQLKNVRDMEASYGLSVSDKERDLIRNALGGQLGMLAGGNTATSAEGIDKARFDNYMAMRNLSEYLATSDLGDRFSQALGPEEMIEAAPVSAPSATPTEALPTMTTPAAVTPAAVTPAAVTPAADTAPVLQSFNPMTYQTSYTTPTVADPTTNMSQYYSDALSTPYFDFNSSAFNAAPAADTAANVASQYLTPQEAQLYVPNPYEKGGRVGKMHGGMMIMGDEGVVNNGIGGILSKYKEIRSEL